MGEIYITLYNSKFFPLPTKYLLDEHKLLTVAGTNKYSF